MPRVELRPGTALCGCNDPHAPGIAQCAAPRRNQTGLVEGEDGRGWVEVRHGTEIDFLYSVRPRPYEAPSFVLRDTRASRAKALEYFRAEVHLREGGQDYDLMGWSAQDIIGDVLDQYERHMHFLQTLR